MAEGRELSGGWRNPRLAVGRGLVGGGDRGAGRQRDAGPPPKPWTPIPTIPARRSDRREAPAPRD